MDTLNNGRVNLVSGENGTPFFMFADQGRGQAEGGGLDSLRGIELNEAAQLFFSPMNLDALQEAIRYQAFLRSGHVIGRQSESELIAIMRAMYLQNGENACRSAGDDKTNACRNSRVSNVSEVSEVRRLNALVIEYAVERVAAELDIYMHYRADISRLPTPMERGEFVSNKGTRSLQQRDF